MNTFGILYRLTDFGESHGPAMGGIIDGIPAGFRLDLEAVQHEVDRRRPGFNAFSSPRKEQDQLKWLSGLSEDKMTLGTPLAFMVENTDAKSVDYEHLRHAFRPGHADFTTLAKYGIREHRGGGRSSARQTLCRVVGGAVAMQFLSHYGIKILTYISGIGPWQMEDPFAGIDAGKDEIVDSSPVRCPDKTLSGKIEKYLTEEIIGRDSVGGRVSLICSGCPAGLGSPVYGKLTSRLADTMMGINGAKGIEFGLGMKSSTLTGKEATDRYMGLLKGADGMQIKTAANLAGGIEGGISNGEDILLSVAFKPTPTRPYEVESINDNGEAVIIPPKGRHDPCIAIRAVPVVKAMAAMVILDQLLLNRMARL